MSEKMLESLSALVDGEADELELRRTLNELSVNDALRAKWSRYHLIGGVLRAQPLIDENKVRTEIWTALDLPVDDPVEVAIEHTHSRDEQGNSWVANMSRVAVAAIVAMAIVFGVNLNDETSLDQPALIAELGSPTGSPTGLPSSPSGLPDGLPNTPDNPTSANPELADATVGGDPVLGLNEYPTQLDMERAKAYWLHHAQQTAINKQPSMVPFVKMASFETQ